jgi:hypothetical protein
MFLYSDLSGIEARTWRWLVGSPSLQMFAEKDKGGPDPYVVTAAKTFVIPISGVTDELRQVGKVLCLLSQYQGGPGKIVGATGVSLEFAEQAIAAFRKSEPQMVNERLSRLIKQQSQCVCRAADISTTTNAGFLRRI